MQRVAVIGNAGSGKSRLARRLASACGLPYVEVDALQWRPDWTSVPDQDFIAAHARRIAEARWVLDGFGSWRSVEDRFRRADSIVLVDLPLWTHFLWAAERQIAWAAGRPDAPGHAKPPPMEDLFKMIWRIDREGMPRLRALVDEAEDAGLAVTRIGDKEALDAFAGRRATDTAESLSVGRRS